MPTQIVGPQMDSHHLPCLVHNSPACGVGYWKDALICLDPLGSNVFSQAVGYLLRNEYDLPFLSTFGTFERQLPVVDITRSSLEDLIDPHPATGHQFQN